jgi:hypothetical protein
MTEDFTSHQVDSLQRVIHDLGRRVQQLKLDRDRAQDQWQADTSALRAQVVAANNERQRAQDENARLRDALRGADNATASATHWRQQYLALKNRVQDVLDTAPNKV